MRVINTHSYCTRMERMYNTSIANSSITHCGDGSTNMTIQRRRVMNINSHCIRLERVYNTSIANTSITHCGDDGIKVECSNDVLIKNVNFLNVPCKSLSLTQTVGITVADSVIYHSHCTGIYLVSTQNTSVHNTTLFQSGIYGSYVNYTSFSDISVMHASSPIQLFGAVHTNIVNSNLSINNVIVVPVRHCQYQALQTLCWNLCQSPLQYRSTTATGPLSAT